MATSQLRRAIQDLRRVIVHQCDPARTDRQLLDRFIEHRDDEAFAALVHRHGRVVWGVCRRVVGHHHDAEDAFQATFLVLARKAPSIKTPALLGNWLYGVAYRTALKARTMARRRQTKEGQVSEIPEPKTQAAAWYDLEPIVDQELAALPEKYRVALVLCDLEGRTGKEAAGHLRIPEGTLSSRLRTARMMLAKRMVRHGLTCSGGAIASLLSHHAASAGAPASVLSSTIQAAPLCAAGHVATGLVSAKVTALMEGVLKAMLLTRLKIMMMVALVLGVGAVGGIVLPQSNASGQRARAEPNLTPPRIAANAAARTQVDPPERPTGPMKAIYAVADLVVPIMGLDPQENKTKEDWLIGKIVRSISPASWQANGGVGTVQYSPKSHSLTVTNSASVQAQVKGLLETMRRMQDVEVAASTSVISLGDAGFRTIREFLPKLPKDGQAVLSDVEAFALTRKAGDHADTHIVQAPKITVFPGQRVQISMDLSRNAAAVGKMQAKLTAHVAVNLQHIDLDVKARVGKTDFAASERVIDGATLAQVQREGNRYLVLLVTPRVILNIDAETGAFAREADSIHKEPMQRSR